MLMTCGACGKEMELPLEIADGQHVKCPFCGECTVYRKPVRIEVPVGAARVNAKPKIGIRRPPAKEASQNVILEDKLRAAINPQPVRVSEHVPSGAVSAAEERVHMFETMRQKEARTKMLRNFVDSAILLMLLAVVVGLCLWWQSHKNKVDEEAERIAAEAEKNRIQLMAERDKAEREIREKKRREQEIAQAKAKAEKERIEQELAKKQREEQEARERAEHELRDNKERYQLFMMAIKENQFDLFVDSVTNDMERSGGELCYLLPSATLPPPLYHVTFETNGTKQVVRLNEDGTKEEIGFDDFQTQIKGVDYLVAKEGMVRFCSTRKNSKQGLLSMSNEANPAETFFGTLNLVLKELKPTYDEITFDIFFTPRGSSKKIFVENLPFGCAWSRQNVIAAITENTPRRNRSYGTGAKVKKFKRTVKIYNGPNIKKGIDGITYVPSVPPSQRYVVFRDTPPVRNCIYRTRTRTYVDHSENWSLWYAKAQQEEAEEQAYYERFRQSHEGSVNAAQAADEAKYRGKVEEIFRNGTLSFRIRKASVSEDKPAKK